MSETVGRLEFSDHAACEELTGLMLSHLPTDGSIGRERMMPENTSIWRPNDPSDRLFFLRRGKVALLGEGVSDHESILQIIAEGEPFGEVCLCESQGGVRMDTARTVLESEVVEVTLRDFLSFLRHRSDLFGELVFTFCRRLLTAHRRIEILTERSARARIGRMLLQLAFDSGDIVGSNPGRRRLKISHEELAKLTAMSRAHVTVTMGKLRRKGLVSYGRGEPLTVEVDVLRSYLTKMTEQK